MFSYKSSLQPGKGISNVVLKLVASRVMCNDTSMLGKED